MTRLIVAPWIFSLAFAAGAVDITRMEPPFWWTDMRDRALSIMLYGEDLSSSEVTIEDSSIKLLATHKTSNPNYLFVEVEIPPANGAEGSTTFPITLRSGDHSISVHYELRPRQTGSAERQGFGPADVIYLITPDRFANGDPANDLVGDLGDTLDRTEPYARHGGDIQGIIDHLDYIAEMGFTQIWLNPVLENAEAEQSYHGYAITDLYRVDPRLGSNELYRKLSHQAAERGIGLIQDVIPNHVGSQHWWMNDPPTHDWIHNNRQFAPTNHRRESLHDPHASQSDRAAFTDGWFVPSMPDLNQDQTLLTNYLVQNTVWWIEYAGLSGLRVDTWPYSGKAFLAEWTSRVMAEYPHLNIVGEEWSIEPQLVGYWQRGAPRFDDHDASLPSLMDFPLQDALIKSLTEPPSFSGGVARLYSMLATDFLYGDPYNLVVFADNHDMSRVFTQLDHDPARFEMAMRFLLTTRGIPQIFYGTEILMSHPGTESHGVIRSDFPGGWPGDQVNAFDGSGMSDQSRSAQTMLRQLLKWRKRTPVVHTGKLTHFTPHDDLYVYFRHHEAASDLRKTAAVMVAMNAQNQEASLNATRFAEILSGYNEAIDIVTGQAVSLDEPLAVPATTTKIWELQ